jgi:hypothetical protein
MNVCISSSPIGACFLDFVRTSNSTGFSVGNIPEKVIIVALGEVRKSFSRAKSMVGKCDAGIVELLQPVGNFEPIRPQRTVLRVDGEQFLNNRKPRVKVWDRIEDQPGFLSGIFSGLAAMAISPFGGFLMLLSSIASVVVGIVFSRILAEFILIVFSINEHLGAIRDQGGMR